MPDSPSRFAAFIAELRHRRVFRVAVVYAGVAFIASEIVSNVFPALHIPDWGQSMVVVLLILGFPIAVGMAWAFDLTAEGLVRTRESKRDQPKKPPRPIIGNKTVAVIAVLAILAAAWSWWGRPGPEAAMGERSIAVLPFVNYSESQDDEWFSDGVTEEIISQLSKISEMTVTSSHSSMTYKGTRKSLKEIGSELGVDNILEGNVRRAGNQVRVAAQLINARTDAHIWSDEYDREFADIFAIQSDVAQQIAAALKATLTPEEKSYIEKKPTENLEAYDYYLKGNVLIDQPATWLDKESTTSAVSMYEKAVELDPTFAMVYARLTQAHLRMYSSSYFGDNTDEQRLARAKSALDRALALDPDHPEVLLAHGYYYYYGLEDYARAIEQLTLALQEQPNNSDMLVAIGFVQRKQGQWEAAATNISKAADFDPLSPLKSHNSSQTFLLIRNWSEAERFADRTILIAPEHRLGYRWKALVYLLSKGDIEEARGVYREALEKIDPSLLADMRSYIEILARDYQKAMDIVEADRPDYFLRKADIYRYLGQPGSSRAYYDSARVTYEEQVRNNPDAWAAHGYLGIAYAGLGRREEAIREGKLAVEILPLSRNAKIGPDRILDLAKIYTMLGEQDAAIDQLEVLLSIPSEITVPLLKLDLQWDPLREHPRFKALLEKYGER